MLLNLLHSPVFSSTFLFCGCTQTSMTHKQACPLKMIPITQTLFFSTDALHSTAPSPFVLCSSAWKRFIRAAGLQNTIKIKSYLQKEHSHLVSSSLHYIYIYMTGEKCAMTNKIRFITLDLWQDDLISEAWMQKEIADKPGCRFLQPHFCQMMVNMFFSTGLQTDFLL